NLRLDIDRVFVRHRPVPLHHLADSRVDCLRFTLQRYAYGRAFQPCVGTSVDYIAVRVRKAGAVLNAMLSEGEEACVRREANNRTVSRISGHGSSCAHEAGRGDGYERTAEVLKKGASHLITPLRLRVSPR